MNNDFTYIVNIVDESGSMNSIRNDAVGGYDAFIEEQKKQPGQALVTTVTFDQSYRVFEDAISIDQAESLNSFYSPGGSTALYDTLGAVIDSVGEKLSAMPEDERPGKVIFTILTDGEENCSRKFTKEQIFEKITLQREAYNWEFLFLAANQDAMATGSAIGVRTDACMNFDASAKGVTSAYSIMTSCVSNYRSTGGIK